MKIEGIKLGQIIKYRQNTKNIVTVFTFTEGRHHCKKMNKYFPGCPSQCYTEKIHGKCLRVVGIIQIDPWDDRFWCLGIESCISYRDATNSEILSFIPKSKDEYVRKELKKLLKERL